VSPLAVVAIVFLLLVSTGMIATTLTD